MRSLLQSGRRKRAISNVVGYVLLISVTISLSVLVYGWLKFYVSDDDVPACPDGVNIVISDYECVQSTMGGGSHDGYLIVTLRNKGLFKVDGYILRVHDDPDADFGFYTFNDTGTAIAPGGENTWRYNFSDYKFDGGDKELMTVSLIEVQPFIIDGGKVSCQSYVSQKINCN